MNPKIHSKWASGTLPDPLEAPLSLNRLPAPLQERSKEAIKTLKGALVSPNASKTTPKLHQNGDQSVHLADFKPNPRKKRDIWKTHKNTTYFLTFHVPGGPQRDQETLKRASRDPLGETQTPMQPKDCSKRDQESPKSAWNTQNESRSKPYALST